MEDDTDDEDFRVEDSRLCWYRCQATVDHASGLCSLTGVAAFLCWL